MTRIDARQFSSLRGIFADRIEPRALLTARLTARLDSNNNPKDKGRRWTAKIAARLRKRSYARKPSHLHKGSLMFVLPRPRPRH